MLPRRNSLQAYAAPGRAWERPCGPCYNYVAPNGAFADGRKRLQNEGHIARESRALQRLRQSEGRSASREASGVRPDSESGEVCATPSGRLNS